MTLTLIDPNLTPGQRLRPPHYIVIERHVDWLGAEENEDPKVEFRVEAETDDETHARHVAKACESVASDGVGVFDNWAGGWLVEPDWSRACPVVAEGFARYDLRQPEPGPAVVDEGHSDPAVPPTPEIGDLEAIERLVSIAGEFGVDRETVLGWRMPEVQAFYRLVEGMAR